ncbi:MAG: alpha/beta fold hydrolase [Atopobiaceae bacterium]|nr:alpha/beta fold hydrolase [Atopobiaceae bacterium]
MRNDVNPLVCHSPFGGELIEEQVLGTTSGKLNPENDVDVARGADRTMYSYVPKSGCPHPKQGQVLMVLRDDATFESAAALLEGLGLAELAEDNHFVVLFPNPLEDGWNYAADPARDDDADFLVRCFVALPGSKGGVAGFNGMIFYLATTPESSAMAAMLAATRPLDAAAVMVGAFPEGFEAPQGEGAEQVAWLYEDNAPYAERLCAQNATTVTTELARGVVCHANAENPCVRHYESANGLSADEVRDAWEQMFSETRRWRNDVYGIYQPRVDFAARGFVGHVDDTSLSLSDGLPRTWFEYVPERLRTATEPMPLVIYLHGINCMGLYGAEQSGWADLADRDGFACVFPDASIEMRWNGWDDPRLPSDVDFILALIEHMGEVVPIDRRRIYVSGFSMGSMMTNALASSYPDVFAGAVALNGPHVSYLETLDDSKAGLIAFNPRSRLKDIEPSDAATSPTRELSDQKKHAFDYRMPFVQFAGLADPMGMPKGRIWPLTAEDKSAWSWAENLSYWRAYDASGEQGYDAETPSGFASDTTEHVDPRFWVQGWKSTDEGNPVYYRFVTVERLAHAVDPRAIALGWDYVKDWAREADGSLTRLG